MKCLSDFELPNVHVIKLHMYFKLSSNYKLILSFILAWLLLIEYKLSHWYNDQSEQILKYFPLEWNSWEFT